MPNNWTRPYCKKSKCPEIYHGHLKQLDISVQIYFSYHRRNFSCQHLLCLTLLLMVFESILISHQHNQHNSGNQNYLLHIICLQSFLFTCFRWVFNIELFWQVDWINNNLMLFMTTIWERPNTNIKSYGDAANIYCTRKAYRSRYFSITNSGAIQTLLFQALIPFIWDWNEMNPSLQLSVHDHILDLYFILYACWKHVCPRSSQISWTECLLWHKKVTLYLFEGQLSITTLDVNALWTKRIGWLAVWY